VRAYQLPDKAQLQAIGGRSAGCDAVGDKGLVGSDDCEMIWPQEQALNACVGPSTRSGRLGSFITGASIVIVIVFATLALTS
jgi:hypothetical protein